jgi:uncharacterized protein (DUF58 family)
LAQDLTKYLDPKVLRRISRLEIKARLVVEGFISGLHRSPYHGYSVEFAEHREYVPGDDVRHIDWKVFGRSDRFYIKQYEEETNLKTHILLDASESMSYAADGVSKFEYGTYVALSLAYLLLKQQDAVGLALFDDRVRSFVAARSAGSQLTTLVGAVEKPPLREKTDLGTIFHEFAERIQRKGLVVIVSDMLDSLANIESGLKHLRYSQHEVILFHVLDHDEIEFPFQRMTLFEGLEGYEDLLADPRSLRQAYLAELNDFREALRRACRRSRIDYVLLNTHDRLDVALSAYLAKRAGSRRR